MSSSRNYDSAAIYRGKQYLHYNYKPILKLTDIWFSYSKLMKPSTHRNSVDGTSDGGFSDYDTRVFKKSSLSMKNQRSSVTNTTSSMSFVGDMSSSAGRWFSGFYIDHDRVLDEKSDDDVRHRHYSIDSSYASESFSSKRQVEGRNMLDYQSDMNNNDRFWSDRRQKVRSSSTKSNDLDNYDQRE
jgi:hypothetical protein